MTIEEQLAAALAEVTAASTERDDLRATVEKLTVGAADELTAAKADIAKREGAPSSMPEVYATLLTKQQIRDVVEYLSSLRDAASNATVDTSLPRALRGLPPAPKATE